MVTLGPRAQATLVCFVRLPPDTRQNFWQVIKKRKKSFVVKNVL
jgi:hypothetical protein